MPPVVVPDHGRILDRDEVVILVGLRDDERAS